MFLAILSPLTVNTIYLLIYLGIHFLPAKFISFQSFTHFTIFYLNRHIFFKYIYLKLFSLLCMKINITCHTGK